MSLLIKNQNLKANVSMRTCMYIHMHSEEIEIQLLPTRMSRLSGLASHFMRRRASVMRSTEEMSSKFTAPELAIVFVSFSHLASFFLSACVVGLGVIRLLPSGLSNALEHSSTDLT